MEAEVSPVLRLLAFGALLPLVSACATAQTPTASAAPPVAYGAWTSNDYRYRIAPGDELSLRFVVNPDLNAQVVVGPDGTAAAPLVPPIKVDGLTIDQANAVLTRAYAPVLRHPEVQTLIANYGSAQIYVGGQVKTPGVHPIKGQLTIAQAVMTAGGFEDTAKTGKVAIIRQRPGDQQVLMQVVDVKSVLHQGVDKTALAILPGDLIFVPRSNIAEADRFVRLYVTGLLPVSIGYNLGGVRY
jgi:polysaccharide export outer membrane protein